MVKGKEKEKKQTRYKLQEVFVAYIIQRSLISRIYKSNVYPIFDWQKLRSLRMYRDGEMRMKPRFSALLVQADDSVQPHWKTTWHFYKVQNLYIP